MEIEKKIKISAMVDCGGGAAPLHFLDALSCIFIAVFIRSFPTPSQNLRRALSSAVLIYV